MLSFVYVLVSLFAIFASSAKFDIFDFSVVVPYSRFTISILNAYVNRKSHVIFINYFGARITRERNGSALLGISSAKISLVSRATSITYQVHALCYVICCIYSLLILQAFSPSKRDINYFLFGTKAIFLTMSAVNTYFLLATQLDVVWN